MKLFTENGQSRSPLDEMEGLETVPQEEVKALEGHLQACLEENQKKERAQRARDWKHIQTIRTTPLS